MALRIEKRLDRTSGCGAHDRLGDSERVVLLGWREILPETVVDHGSDAIGDHIVVKGGQGSVEGAWRTISPSN
jgi:hypothetical protein